MPLLLTPFEADRRSKLNDPFFFFKKRRISNKATVSAQMYAKTGRYATMNISVPSHFRLHCVQKWGDLAAAQLKNG